MTMPRTPLLLALVLCAAAAPAQQRAERPAPLATLHDNADVLGVVFPASVSQGAMVIGKVPANSVVRHAGRTLRVTGYGSVVFGVGRDEKGPVVVEVQAPGTPVKAPADGVVTFANPGLYLTGGTVVLDHGHGISSNFLHLSRIDVKVGDVVKQGATLAAVGATGRATGPHLHWGMNWFDVRIDPLLVLGRK